MTRARLALAVGAALVVPVLFAGLWIWVLAHPSPLEIAWARQFPWPIACSVRGCVTTTDWLRHYEARTAFAQSSGQSVPSATEALTTLVRQHLVEHALARTPVTRQDAVRYREEVLNARDEALVQDATALTLEEYDTLVVLPLLQQEALRQERRVESFDELFTLLARERPVMVLPWGLSWDRGTAQVIQR